MTDNDKQLLDSVKQMEDEAPSVGLCGFAFKILHDEIAKLITDRDDAAQYRAPLRVLPYKGYAGKCPRCSVVFLDDSTKFCGNCGQLLKWETEAQDGIV